MVGSYNCLRLDNKSVFPVEVYEQENDNTKFFEIGDKKYQFKEVRVGQLRKFIYRDGRLKDSDILNLWKINNQKHDLNNVSTEDGIKKLGGELMESEQSFVNYFSDVPDAKDVNIHIVAVITNTTAGKCLPMFYLSNKKFAVTKYRFGLISFFRVKAGPSQEGAPQGTVSFFVTS